jgi:hypothetical protein
VRLEWYHYLVFLRISYHIILILNGLLTINDAETRCMFYDWELKAIMHYSDKLYMIVGVCGASDVTC